MSRPTSTMTVDILSIFPQDQVLTPGNGQAYEDNIQRWADNAVKRAKFIVIAKSAQDVAKAVRPDHVCSLSTTKLMPYV